jgi:hypothetical protein
MRGVAVRDTGGAMVAELLRRSREFFAVLVHLFTASKSSHPRYRDPQYLPQFLRFTLRAFHTFRLRLRPGMGSSSV